jgi:alpha-D-ribose 1-methylphosphonate 5-triphosphate synthase subunit PhnI
LAESTLRKGEEAAEIELTYSATGGISQAKPALGGLIVCIIQVVLKPRNRSFAVAVL